MVHHSYHVHEITWLLRLFKAGKLNTIPKNVDFIR